jgi:hypothetical protein
MPEKGIDAWEQIRLNQMNFLLDKCLKSLELRYQVSVIIFPTIVGLWGFIGLIITSKLFKNNGLFFNFGITFGVCVTIFLLMVWRIRVHDLSDEEIDAGRQLVRIEMELLYKPISKEEADRKVEEAIAEEQGITLHYYGMAWGAFHNGADPAGVREGYEEYYKKLKSIRKIQKFYDTFYKQITDRTWLINFDTYCEIIVGILGPVGSNFILFSPCFTTLLSLNNYYSLPFTFITTIIFMVFVLIAAGLGIWEMEKLKSKSQRDDKEFSNYINELCRSSGRLM